MEPTRPQFEPDPWVEKLWGYCRTLYRDDQVEIVEAEIVPGGYSSIHKHLWKDNTFLVLEGELEVELYPALKRHDTYTLTPTMDPLKGGGLTVVPFVPHRFRAVQATRLIEIYRAVPGKALDPDDISRMSDGGVRGK